MDMCIDSSFYNVTSFPKSFLQIPAGAPIHMTLDVTSLSQFSVTIKVSGDIYNADMQKDQID